MKTITVKADREFDALLDRLARRLKTTRIGVIRDAVRNYQRQLEREALRQRVLDASLRTRAQAAQLSDELEAANADGM